MTTWRIIAADVLDGLGQLADAQARIVDRPGQALDEPAVAQSQVDEARPGDLRLPADVR